MGTASGRPEATVVDLLRDETYRFEFFQAVRVLMRQSEETARRQTPPVGGEGPPADEAVRFSVVQSLSYAATDLSLLETTDDGPPKMLVEFLGLTGTHGVLPFHYTRFILERLQQKDPSLRVFFDLFNHRIVSLFYRCWEKHRFPVAYERFARAKRRQAVTGGRSDSDLFTRMLFSLVGMGTPGLRGRQSIDDEVTLYYAGHFARSQPRSACVLEDMLNDFFDVPIKLEQFQGRWLYLDPSSRTQLSSGSNDGGPLANAQSAHEGARLGYSFVAGCRVWDSESQFRLRVGPMNYDRFSGFFPGGRNLREMRELVRLYVGPQFDFEIQPILRKEEVPSLQLRSKSESESTPKMHLGWNLWLNSRPMTRDADDARFLAGE